MHPRYLHTCFCCNKVNETFEEMQKQIEEINEAIECIEQCKLSQPVKELAINELDEQIANIKERMHKKVNEL